MLAFLLFPLIASVVGAAQLPLPFDRGASASGPAGHSGPGEPEDIFLKQFSQPGHDTAVALQSQLEALYANSSVLTTQARFDLLDFAAESGLALRQRKDLAWLARRGYSAGRRTPAHLGDLRAPGASAAMAHDALRAAQGPDEVRIAFGGGKGKDKDGGVFDSVVLGAWELEWEGADVLAIVARFVTQWHLVSSSRTASESLFGAVAKATAAHPDVVWVFDRGFWEPSRDLWREVSRASWADVILDDDFKHHLRKDYGGFLGARKTYRRLGVPWKRGLIFLGPPGNGKTSALKAIMGEVGVPSMYVRSMRTSWGTPQENIGAIFRGARQQAPCLLIFEDLDSMIDDDNRSYFLNEVDGMDSNDGLLMIATTNHFDRLDPGLSNRPSRFDRKYNFPNPHRAQRRQYAAYWQKKLKGADGIQFPDALIDEFASKTDRFSFAYMKEAFVSTLLAIAGNDGKHDAHFPERLLKEVKCLRKEIDDGDEKLASEPAEAH